MLVRMDGGNKPVLKTCLPVFEEVQTPVAHAAQHCKSLQYLTWALLVLWV